MSQKPPWPQAATTQRENGWRGGRNSAEGSASDRLRDHLTLAAEAEVLLEQARVDAVANPATGS